MSVAAAPTVERPGRRDESGVEARQQDGSARLAFAGVMLAALLLRVWHLGARSLWTDEGSTWTAASSSLPDLVRRCIERDASPPLYYLLTSVALRFGTSEAALRSVSVIASLGLVWITYRFVRLHASRGEATLAAAIVALSPYQVMYAQEARTYALVAFFLVTAMFLFARAVVRGRVRDWIAYAVVSVLGLYTQSLALLGIGVQAAFVALTPAGRRRWMPWLLAQLAVATAFLPWLLASTRQAGHLSDSHWYLTAPGGHGVFQVLRAVFLSPVALVTPPAGSPWPGLDAFFPRPLAHALLVLVPLVPVAAAFRSLRAGAPRGPVLLLALGALVLPLIAVYGVSRVAPLWLPRYFVFLTPFLAVLLARGLCALPSRALRVAWVVLLLATSAYGWLRYDVDYTKEPWREATREIAAKSDPERTAVLVLYDLDPFAFYDRKLPRPLAAFEVSHPEVPFASRFTPRQLDEAEARALERARPYDDVWVVVRSANSDVRRELARRAERAAAEGRVETERREWTSATGPVRAVRFQRTMPRP